jgi:hypothetical protein
MSLWVVDIQPARRLALSGEPIVEVLRENGQEVIETLYDPESGKFPLDLKPIFDSGRPLILRGSVGFAAWAHTNWSLHPGAFRSELLRPSAWLPAYGALCLNADAIITTYAEFDAQRTKYENMLGGSLFIKPADGSKLLSGTVLEPGRSLFDAHYSMHRRWSPIADDFRLLLARVSTTFAEWRFIIAGDKVIARSQYKVGSVVVSHPDAPEGAETVAEAVAKHSWRPTDVFVADVAETEDGFRLLELNTFGTSGFYDCDLGAIVQAVSPYAI